jgi:LysM repeat protein
MANQNGRVSKPIVLQRAFRWVALLAALAMVFSLAWTQPADAGNGANVIEVPAPAAPAHPQQTIGVRSYNVPAPLQQVAQPPIPGLGGTCISGYLIDSYHEMLGAGWEITLTPATGASQTTTTDTDGKFAFTELAGGTYTVELKVADGWRPFTPTSFPVTLSGVGDGCAEVRFKLEALPCIKVVKVDANGAVDGEPVGIPGWNFKATQDNTTLQSVTDGQGLAYFYNLTPGDWIVSEEEKTGWRPADGYASTMTLTLYPPEVPGTCVTALFVNEQVNDACVIVQKTDVAGAPVEGWNINLTRDDGTQAPHEGTTDETGQITFDHLALGNWTVTEETREWWRPVGESTASVSLERPGFCQVVKFVNEPLGCVDGYKINHLEQGLSGWTINAVNDTTGETFTTVTDENGYFYFHTLSLGAWTISESLQPGWEPVTAPEFSVNVTEPFQCETVRFKNRTDFACLDVFKRDEIDGVGLPGWNIVVQPAYGGSPVTGITDGTGWVRFNQLTPGTYIVKEEAVPGWTAVSPAEVQVELQATGTCAVLDFYNIQTHMIPQEPVYPPKPPKPEKYVCPLYYTVHCGDTLWSLSQYFGVPVNAIARVNHIKNPSLIYVGQRLCIPLGDP